MFYRLRLSLYNLFKIHRGEEKKLLLFFSILGFVSVAIGIISNSIDSIYLKSSKDAVENLPVMFIISSFSLIIVSLYFSNIIDRVNKRLTYQLVLLISIGVIVSGRIMLYTDEMLWSSILYIVKFVISVILFMQFWELTNLYFDIREGKRLFPLIAIGSSIGYSVGSFLVSLLASNSIVNSEDTLIISAVFIFISAALLFYASQYRIEAQKRKSRKSRREMGYFSDIAEGLKTIKKTSFLRIFTVSTFIFGITSGIIMYEYNNIVNNLIVDTDKLTSFLGVWRGIANILISVIQASLMTKLLSQAEMDRGWFQAVIIRSASLILFIIFFMFSMAATADFSRQMIQALMSPAATLAFAILPRNVRGRAMSLNNGVVAPAGMFIAGIVLLLFVALDPAFNTVWFFVAIIVILIVVRLILNVRINREYLKKLSKNLQETELDFSTIKQNVDQIVKKGELLDKVFELFREQNSAIKIYLLNILKPALKVEKQIERLVDLLDSEEDIVKERIISILIDIDEFIYVEKVAQYTDSNEPQLKKAALFYLLKYGDKNTRNEILKNIEETVVSGNNIDDIVIGIDIMGKTKNEEYLTLLSEKLESHSLPVKKSAITSIKNIDPENAIDVFVFKLPDKELREHILNELLTLKPVRVEKGLIDYYKSLSHDDFEIKSDIIESFSQLHTNNCKNVLVSELYENINKYTDENMEIDSSSYLNIQIIIDKIIDALLRFNQDFLNLNRKLLLRLASHDAKLGYTNLILKSQANRRINSTVKKLIIKLLEEEINDCVRRIGIVTALLTKSEEQKTAITKALKKITSNDRRIRSEALEIIDNLCDKDILNYLMPFIEKMSYDERLNLLSKHFKNIDADITYMLYTWVTFDDVRPKFKYKKMIAEYIPQNAIT